MGLPLRPLRHPSRAAPAGPVGAVGIALVAGLFVLASACWQPEHNWDEVAYAFLARFHHCGPTEHHLWLDQLREGLPAPVLADQMADAYGEAVEHQAGYFCSLLPFYTIKKFYIVLLRFLHSWMPAPLQVVRLASAVPAAALTALISASLWRSSAITPFGRWLAIGSVVAIGRSLGMLSSPDALASFLLIAGLLALAVPQGAPLARGVIGGGSLALALATRSTLAIPLLLLVLEGWRGGGGGGRWFRSPLVLGALAGLLLDRSIGRLVVGLPEGYNQLTLLEFSLDGPLGADWLSRGAVHNLDPALLLAGGGAIPFAGLMLQAYGDLVETVLPLLAVVLLTALLIAVPWRREGALLRAGSGVAWARVRLVLALVGGYLLQLLLFPQPDGRFLAPYALLILLIAAGWVIPDTRAAP